MIWFDLIWFEFWFLIFDFWFLMWFDLIWFDWFDWIDWIYADLTGFIDLVNWLIDCVTDWIIDNMEKSDTSRTTPIDPLAALSINPPIHPSINTGRKGGSICLVSWPTNYTGSSMRRFLADHYAGSSMSFTASLKSQGAPLYRSTRKINAPCQELCAQAVGRSGSCRVGACRRPVQPEVFLRECLSFRTGWRCPRSRSIGLTDNFDEKKEEKEKTKKRAMWCTGHAQHVRQEGLFIDQVAPRAGVLLFLFVSTCPTTEGKTNWANFSRISGNPPIHNSSRWHLFASQVANFCAHT